jgi:hypothetical protein
MSKKILLIICCWMILLPISCNFGNNNSDSVENVLSSQDSIAVRGILDANGLDTVKVRDVITLQNSAVVELHFSSSLHLNKFVFSKYLNDLLNNSQGIGLMNNTIDTLIFEDTIYKDLSIRLDFNKLKTIPDDIVKLMGNFTIYLDYNQLTSISPNIMNCNVSYVNVDSNYLCNVSDTMKQWLNTKSGSTAWQSRQTCH